VKAFSKFLFFMLLFPVPTSAAAQPPNDYFDCNVFASFYCFSIKQREQLVYSIPVDFVLYDVTLANDLRIRIYDGFWPQQPGGFGGYKLLNSIQGATEKTDVYIGEERGQVHWEIYYSSTRPRLKTVMHASLVTSSPEELETAKEFFGRFWTCLDVDRGVACDRQRPLIGVLDRR
jgi:hypothetical protein